MVLQHGARRYSHKTLTTHEQPDRGVISAIDTVLAESGQPAAAIELVLHGTTLATNALIERRGATTALLTTSGHRDVLQLAYEHRFEQYNIQLDRPAPLVPRALRIGIDERLDRDGHVLRPLDESQVLDALPALDAAGVGSVAIGFLHAYANPAHERRVAEILSAQRPQWSLTLASEVCPEIREYDRLSTACANAYVRPLMCAYLDALASRLKQQGFRCPFLLMGSGGGLCDLETARRFPIRLVESGPAAGAILAGAIARRENWPRVLSFDMGGTTAKLCLIDDGQALRSRSFEVDRAWRFKKGSGLPLRIPVIEMVEIGAGGGSVASIDALGLIQVGPQSVGSEPGPAAYGRGGERPTVSDADVVLGRIDADGFAGGALPLDAAAATAAIRRHVATPLGLATPVAALGIVEIVDENMSQAAQAHASEFGLALEQRTLIAFGGAAPLHAARLGEKLGVERILIPADAGVGSAVGMLQAPVAFEVVRSGRQLLDSLDAAAVNTLFSTMRQEAQAIVRAAEPTATLTECRQAAMRYQGQGHEILVDLPLTDLQPADAGTLRERFEAAYAQLYGQAIPDADIEALSWTLSLSAPLPTPLASPPPRQGTPAQPAGQQTLVMDRDSDATAVPMFRRQDLVVDQIIDGPALISENQTTTFVSASFQARCTRQGDLLLSRRGSPP